MSPVHTPHIALCNLVLLDFDRIIMRHRSPTDPMLTPLSLIGRRYEDGILLVYPRTSLRTGKSDEIIGTPEAMYSNIFIGDIHLPVS